MVDEEVESDWAVQIANSRLFPSCRWGRIAAGLYISYLILLSILFIGYGLWDGGIAGSYSHFRLQVSDPAAYAAWRTECNVLSPFDLQLQHRG